MFSNLRGIVENYNSTLDFTKLSSELKHILENLTLNKNVLDDIAANSYAHPLGFEKYILHTFEDDYCLRLHFWQNQNAMVGDIHSHCSDFKSIILLGSLTNNTYVLNKGDNHKLFIYLTNQLKENVVVEKGTSDYLLTESQKINSKEYYFQKSELLHNLCNIDNNTLTLSLWSKRENPAIVLKNLNSKVEDCYYGSTFTSNQLLKKINLLLWKLAYGPQ